MGDKSFTAGDLIRREHSWRTLEEAAEARRRLEAQREKYEVHTKEQRRLLAEKRRYEGNGEADLNLPELET